MSWHCGVPQPMLMDEELIQKAVDEQMPQDQAGRIIREEGIHYNKVLMMRLDFKNILKIDNLWDFTSLTKLYLNNNLIQKIRGLEPLLNLTWLNLSFNKIEQIEGLESLRKLEYLNLSNNRISTIENLNELERLSQFSIANNLLQQQDNLLYLRKFKNLRTLNIRGNPVSKEEDFKFFIAAFFPKLMFLDYRLLKETTKQEAYIKYFTAVEKITQDELETQQAHDVEQRRADELQLHSDAFVESLNGSHLFKEMFKEDPDADKIKSVAGVTHLQRSLEQKMTDLCTQLFETGVSEHKRRESEVNSFLEGQAKALEDYQQRAAEILADFEERHMESLEELQELTDPVQLMEKIGTCHDGTKQLYNSLMSLEGQLSSQMEFIVKELDTSLSDMIGNFTETAQGIFAQCRDLEDKYHQKMQEIAVATLQKVASDSLEVKEMPTEVRWLFSDKEMVMDALTTGHDNHQLKINDRETQLITRADAWRVSLIQGIQDKEVQWNRTNVSGIHRYIDNCRNQLEKFKPQEM